MNRNILLGIGMAIVVVLGAYAMFAGPRANAPERKNADMMKTSNQTPIVKEEAVEYFTGAKGYFVRPEAPGDYPGVVMIHENRGLRPEIRETAETLAKEGYMVLAVDLLGGTAEDQTGARALTAGFKQETGVANMRAAAAYLRSKGAMKLASLGWCFGGKQSVELAISGEPLDATIVYYGGGMATTTQRLAPIKWPVLGIFGDKDQSIPVEMVRSFESSLNALGVRNEIHIYPGVGHAFANPSGMNYAPEATMDAWQKTLAFLQKNLKTPAAIGQGSDTPQRMTLEGEYTCLPHKDLSGPQTEECAVGLKTAEGFYYALDTNLLSALPLSLKSGDRIRANGLLTPIERLSSDHWQKYNVKGIFSVTDSLEKR